MQISVDNRMLTTCLSKLHSLRYFMIADYIYIYIYIQSFPYIYKIYIFPTGENGGRVPPTSLRFAHPPSLEKEKFLDCPPSHQIFIRPTTKQQFSSYNPIKTAFLAVVIALAPSLF